MRSRLNERLSRAARYPVTLIVAPAGFGKTVALRDFIATARLDAVRYDVPREDSTLLAFSHGLARALAGVAPEASSSFAQIQAPILSKDTPVVALADWFNEHLRRVVATIVIDDLHHASVDPRVVDLMVTLIERTTGRINWIIATRSDAGLPVASWLGYGRIDVPIGEDDLRFTEDEALAAAEEAQTNIATDEVGALRDLTAGWPVALSIALRTRTHAVDLRAATDGAREMLYRYLAEQVYANLTEAQRSFLLDTSVFSTFDASLAEALGGSVAFLADLRRGATFISEPSPGTFRYHDLFRDFLESELRRSGTQRWRAAHARGAELLEQRGDAARALALFVLAEEGGDVRRLLAERGIDLYERGEAETIARALNLLPPQDVADARVLALRAVTLAGRGHFDLAERDFVDAIARADEIGSRLQIVHRYAIELIRHDRDAIALLAPYAADETIAVFDRVPLLGTYATALARANLQSEAVDVIATAIAAVDVSISEPQRARLYQQAAFVHQLLPDRGNAWNYARLAIDLASAHGLFDVVARAYSVLYTIVYDDEDDPIESLALLDRLIEASRKSGSLQTRIYGVLASIDIEVDRGDDVAIEQLDGELERAEGAMPRTSAETLLPAQALRAAWSGDFDRAYQTLAGSSERVGGSERRALRFSEIALYAIASGRAEEGAIAVAAAQNELSAIRGATRRTVRTLLVLALVELMRGHSGAAHRHITEAEAAMPRASRRLQTFAHAVRALYRRSLGQAETAEVNAALERMRSAHFGGIARLLSTLPLSVHAERGGYGQLTAAEREVLALLAQGGSSKEIANQTGRSAATIDTHIRSICRKLDCSGRREAVALAVRSGWVRS